MIESLSEQYDPSVFAIDLLITLYLVFQAVSPAFFGPLSDTLGRRPVFLITFFVYCAASIGLTLNKHSYVALLVLRSLQNIGSSAVMSLAYAVVADVSVLAERGKILGPMLASTNFGPCFGPVISGGIVLATGQTQWCFWTLVIFGASSFLLIGWTMPETGRTVSSNGAIGPHGIWRTWRSYFRHRTPEYAESGSSLKFSGDVNLGKTGFCVWSFPKLLSSVRLIFYADTFLTLWSAASPYAPIPLIYGQ